MDKKLVVTYLVAVLVLGSGAYGLVRWWKKPKAKELAADSAPDPLFYKSMTTAERLIAARYRLDSMTRNDIAPGEIGPIKDEVALLATDEAVVDLIVERFAICKAGGIAQLSAYMEIFARIRHPKFVPLIAEGILSEREASQINALDAAIVQRDPRLVSYLAQMLPQQTGYRAQRILEALGAIGTTDALAACLRAISAPERSKKIWAMTAAASAHWTDAKTAVEAQHADADPMVRTIAAFALASFGDPRGKEWLVAAAKDRTLPEDARAQAIQNLLQVGAKEKAGSLAELVDTEAAAVRREARVTLLVWRDPALIARLKSELGGLDPAKSGDAIAVFARGGVTEDMRYLASVADMLQPDDLAALLRQLPQGGNDAALEIYEKYVRRNDELGILALRYAHRFGKKSLELLKTLAAETKDEERLMLVIAAIASVATREAVDVLMTHVESPSKKIRNWARQNVRLVEQEMLKR